MAGVGETLRLEAAFLLRSRVCTQMHLTNQCNVIFFFTFSKGRGLVWKIVVQNDGKLVAPSLPSFVRL